MILLITINYKTNVIHFLAYTSTSFYSFSLFI